MKRANLAVALLATVAGASGAGAGGPGGGRPGWCQPRVVRVGEQKAANERFVVLKQSSSWVSGIALRVNSDDLKMLDLQRTFQFSDGRQARLWDVSGNGPAEVRFAVPPGHAVVGVGVRCNSDDARHMVVYHRRFDARGLTGPLHYAVVQHDRSSGSSWVVQTGFDRPTAFPIEQTALDPSRLLIGLGMRVNNGNFKHVEATFAKPTVW